ncbi:YbaB/EbfC family nucleoid-associated protein [Marinoscillum sp. MHG1-6]|uniref:YbaB/EbfC family nucleoid-associated protein n=1 Tax=Marinoscillum sp. MHG1-6 TaxID=2959627 RepID=UPI00215722ED|nr:YbaB/EbfC family nucleoid-associated protein [Marinoscillum sp. MHG1-6]
MFDMMKMMGKLKEVQEKMRIAQEGLKDITAEGESGAGMVKATVNGQKELIDLQIDPSIINQDDSDMMKDLIIAATNKAIQTAEIKAKEHLRSATDGMMPNIPGFDLNNMM